MNPFNHTVLITGGSSGIGFAIAKKFADHGNRVIIVSKSEASINKAISELPGAKACVADVTIPSDRERLVIDYPDISILVNSAGILENITFIESPPQTIERELATNLLAPMVMSRLFLPVLLRASSAAIIYISSSLAIVPKERAAVYSASKAALHSFSKALRWQLEATAIRVFEVMPSIVETAMTDKFRKKKMALSQFADRFWHGFLSDHFEMPIGNARLLSAINRLSPTFAAHIMRKAE